MESTTKTLQPLGDRVLVLETKQEKNKKTTGGIIIPDTVSAEDVKTGKVVAVGPGLFTQTGTAIPMSVKTGDEVILPPFTNGNKVKLAGVEYELLRESDILAILK